MLLGDESDEPLLFELGNFPEESWRLVLKVGWAGEGIVSESYGQVFAHQSKGCNCGSIFYPFF